MANYYSPRVIDTGYGQGLAQGASAFASLFAQGMGQKRASEERQKDRDWQGQMLERREQRDMDMMKKRWEREDQKELISKREEAEALNTSFQFMQQHMPDLLTPEMEDKFYSGSTAAKREIMSHTSVLAQRYMKQQDEERRWRRAQETAPLMTPEGAPSTTHFMTGNGQVLPYPKDDPQPGMVDVGGGMSYVAGEGGRPIPPDYLLAPQWPQGEGPPMIGPAFDSPGAARQPNLRSYKMKDGSIQWFNPETGEQVTPPGAAPASAPASGGTGAPAGFLNWKPK